ncbi:hypothetical protein BOX15_Mlig001788g2 [Macrostomum lignano]|uniref:EamA domain-containing protein n=1 Tax=Macrostomum lignano TaxID=282301 RepID=A0A267DPK2_9PLAT|nr:hypothetical protein BOX15_Mlig001788g2 [Macrostomum lignano]
MLLLCAAVGLVWGVTNALMKASTAADTSDSKAWSLGALLRNWKYLTALAANQSASLLFLWSLAEASLSIAVPLTNTVTFLATSLTGWLINGEKLAPTTLLAMALMSAGIYLCVTS